MSSNGATPETGREAAADERAGRRGAWFWAAVPVALLVAMLFGLGIMAAVAIDDPSFATERDYYTKAMKWDDTATQRANNSRLGWQLEVALSPRGSDAIVRLKVLDREGQVVQGARVAIEAFHNARAAKVLEGRLVPGIAGEHHIALPMKRPGLWELRFLVERGRDRFTAVVRRDLPRT